MSRAGIEASQAFSGGGEDGIADTRSNERKRRFPDAAWRTAAFDQMSFKQRSVRNPQKIIVVEILLPDAAVPDCDTLLKGGA